MNIKCAETVKKPGCLGKMRPIKSLIKIMVLVSFVNLGCGHKNQSETTFKVTETFSVSSMGYGGGLLISGKNNSTGETFTESLINGLQFSVLLNKGNWVISAVGWKSSKIFDGDPECAKVDAKLSNEKEIVSLNMSSANCADSFFSRGELYQNKPKKIGLITTCNTFFNGEPNPTDKISEKIVNNSTPENFCDDPYFPLDLKSKVKGIKIFSINKKIHEKNSNFGFSSSCLKSSSGSSIIYPSSNGFYNLILPVGNVPLGIGTYEDENCTDPIARYPFKNGLMAGDSDEFDHLLLNSTTTPNNLRLIIPSNDLKRALSPLSALVPSIRKKTGNILDIFVTQPSNLGGNDYQIPINTEALILEDEKSCQNIVTNTYYACQEIAGKTVIKIKIDPPSIYGTGNGSFNIYTTHSPTKTYKVLIDTSRARTEVIGLVMKLIGHKGDDKTSRFFLIGENENHYGFLYEIRNMFHASGAGGVLSLKNKEETFKEACLNLVQDKTVSIYEKEIKSYKSYRVVIGNDVKNNNPSKFICSNDDPNPLYCTDDSKFDKRLTIFDIINSSIKPIFAIEFNCTNRMGRLEMRSYHSNNNSELELNEMILNWNTQESQHERFDVIQWTKRIMTEDLRSEERSMARVFKNGDDDFEGAYFLYQNNQNSNSSTFNEMIKFERFESYDSGTTLRVLSPPCCDRKDQISSQRLDIFKSSSTQISTLLNQEPKNNKASFYFTLNSNYPGSLSLDNTSFKDLIGGSGIFENSDKIDDSLELKLKTLGESSFENKFGSNFLKNP